MNVNLGLKDYYSYDGYKRAASKIGYDTECSYWLTNQICKPKDQKNKLDENIQQVTFLDVSPLTAGRTPR